MKYLFSFLLLSLSLSYLQAQDFCKASSVFFDLNRSELKPAGIITIDSLVKSMNGSEFILEVYGYTDTSNTADYNRKLSQSRIESVLNHLKSTQVVPKEIRTFNEGEDFNSSQQSKHAGFQRRVDIYLTPMEGNDVVFKSSSGVIVKRDLATFGDCGICALKPKIRYLQNEADAKANGIDLFTDREEPLETYGMALFDIDTCSSLSPEERRNMRTCMQMPASKWNRRVELFELVEQPGNDVWRLLNDSWERDSIRETVRFCSRSGRINLDVRKRKIGLILPEASTTGKSFFTFLPERPVLKLANDTLDFPSDVHQVISYYAVGRDWHLFLQPAQKIRRLYINRDSLSPNYATIYESDYLVASPKVEIELKVKKKNIDKVGYYHRDFDLFIPLERRGGNSWYGTIYEDGFELCYIKNTRYFIEKNKGKKIRMKQKDGHQYGKIKQFYLLKKNRLSWRNAKRRELV
ncbi:OmpA family protein [Fluviicola sp.]|uniref:OmpA family protein n=1 Tax=Fluviicola sp. TaxID=1917219 RepID=UPI0031D2D0A6